MLLAAAPRMSEIICASKMLSILFSHIFIYFSIKSQKDVEPILKNYQQRQAI